MANIPTAPHDRITAEKVARSPKCARCRNHGFVVALKGHSDKCQFRSCLCWKCSLIVERTKILASQRRIKTVHGNYLASAEAHRPEHAAQPGEATDSAGNSTSSNGVNGETGVSAVKSPVRRADTDGKTYRELRAPVIADVSSSADHCEVKTPAGLSAPEPPPFPGEYRITEAIPRHIYPGEMFAIPFPVYPHYPDRYMYPAVLVTVRSTAPGTFRKPIVFLPSSPGALSHPLDTCESHVPLYSPYPPYPEVRDEHGPRPQHHPQSHMDGEQITSKVPPQAGCISEGQVCGIHEADFVPVGSPSTNSTP
ncbi:doublesex- and mab-3-related transcription factor B1-like [Myxocyprinus asiaticus]|uniref:doublesex- and mab-3-related transcription factor B1-like n=1 Tax=Myxocyprinus asiaticus TaxID=70543 RepID=UPI002221BD05|nr:doublesex- and mab-3-related transcription factor B1-like [Myxocyprinus asiaticus]